MIESHARVNRKLLIDRPAVLRKDAVFSQGARDSLAAVEFYPPREGLIFTSNQDRVGAENASGARVVNLTAELERMFAVKLKWVREVRFPPLQLARLPADVSEVVAGVAFRL